VSAGIARAERAQGARAFPSRAGRAGKGRAAAIPPSWVSVSDCLISQPAHQPFPIILAAHPVWPIGFARGGGEAIRAPLAARAAQVRTDRIGCGIPVMTKEPTIELLCVENSGMAATADNEQIGFAPDIFAKILERYVGGHVRAARPSA
jgi:hypothetical protein